MKNKITKNLGLEVSEAKVYTFWDESFPFVVFGMMMFLGGLIWALASL